MKIYTLEEFEQLTLTHYICGDFTISSIYKRSLEIEIYIKEIKKTKCSQSERIKIIFNDILEGENFNKNWDYDECRKRQLRIKKLNKIIYD